MGKASKMFRYSAEISSHSLDDNIVIARSNSLHDIEMSARIKMFERHYKEVMIFDGSQLLKTIYAEVQK